MESNHTDRNLLGVLFPGIVKNDEKAVQCLGGIRQMSQVYSMPSKKRLSLSFQPENPYVKKIYADLKSTSGVLLKVKVKTTKTGDEVKREVLSTTVVGRVRQMYNFDSMSDFQFMPVHMEGATEQHQCMLDQLIPTGVDNVSFLLDPAQEFIIPTNFTRSDKPINYAYTDKRYPLPAGEEGDVEEKEVNLHSRTRDVRTTPSVRYVFNLIDDFPTEPNEYFIENKNTKAAQDPQLEKDFLAIKKLFEERPIMSQNLIKYHTKAKTQSLKIILPCLAFYMRSGPWRMLWVRLGYDPRKDPEARKYQTLDFRLRHQAGLYSMVMTREQIVHYKKADRVSYRSSKKRALDSQFASYEDVSEGAVYFRPGMAPAQRQIFYMYCDVKLPEVEEILAAKPPPGYLCHPKRGWLPPNVDHTCRDHIFRYVKQTLLSMHNADLKFEVKTSDEESNSDDEEDEGDELDDTANI